MILDRATPYDATSATSSYRVFCERRKVHRNGTIFQKSIQMLAYADDIYIIGYTKRYVTATFSAIERESAKMGLAVNEDKTNCVIDK